MAEENTEEYVESGETHTGLREAMRGAGENGLDLVCTQLAVDFQCLDADTLEARLSKYYPWGGPADFSPSVFQGLRCSSSGSRRGRHNCLRPNCAGVPHKGDVVCDGSRLSRFVFSIQCHP